MLKNFICPDGEKCEITKCLAGCRMEGRCAPRGYLARIAEERVWEGKPSVTQLIKGTRQAYLELTEDFSLDPQDALYRTIGSSFHEKIEDGDLAEVHLEEDGIVGTLDLIEEDTLWDHKMTGSYKGMKVLGLQKFDGPEIVDDKGEPVRFVRGPRKGQVKHEVLWKRSGTPDMHDWELQVNKYRIMYNRQCKSEVLKKQQIFMAIRDSGLKIAQERGIDKTFYIVPVRVIPDAEIDEYFNVKKDLLLKSLATKVLPAPCSEEETWQGRRCIEGYCPVSDICPDCPYKNVAEEREDNE